MAETGKDLARAAQLLARDELVAIPTETVYGLAGNAWSEDAILKIFKVKDRPSFDPLIAHVGSMEVFSKLTVNVTPLAEELMSTFWPGPLTILFTKNPEVSDLLTSGLPTIAVRMPDHPLSLALLKEIDFPLAAPSANPFGYISPTTPQHVEDQLGARIPYILDGGPTEIGIESTIIRIEDDQIIVLRTGGLSLEDLQKYGEVKLAIHSGDNPTAPGQLNSHYSPSKRLVIGDIPSLLMEYANKKIGIISFQHKYEADAEKIILSPNGNIDEAARNFFGALRTMDGKELDVIITEKLPDEGIGLAINDRLKRAGVTIH